tara:strand:- start:792 stop:953 length:162 start_codon:yes stop_codon:yes gene_type:complete
MFYERSTVATTFKAELSSDGGATWHSEITKTVNKTLNQKEKRGYTLSDELGLI